MAGYNEEPHVRCEALCPGGHPCCCETWKGSTHGSHICSNPHCVCHSQERYRKPKPDLFEVVAKVGNISFVRYNGVVGFSPLEPKNLSYDEWVDLRRAKGLEKIPDSVAPGVFGDGREREMYKRMVDENGDRNG